MAELLAKPAQELLEHLREVAQLGEYIARRLGIEGELFKRVLLACWFHDVGKATRSFQSYMHAVRALEEAKERGAAKEELVGLEKEAKRKRKTYPHPLAALVPSLIVEQRVLSSPLVATGVILTHHSPYTGRLYKDFESLPDYDDNFPDFFRDILRLLNESGFTGLSNLPESLSLLLRESPTVILDGSLSFGNSRKSLRGILKDAPPKEFAAVKTVLHLADWLASARRLDASCLFLQKGKERILEYVNKKFLARGKSLRGFQKRIQEVGDKIYLRAPTGVGKTEALLLWAGDAERILYLLPTQATVNAMWHRLKRVYGENTVGIAHGKATYVLRKENEEDPLNQRLFASVFAKPVVVATLDQYLMGYLHGRHWEERTTLSQRSAIILDEIHSYEPYTLGLLERALKKNPPVKLALASATLPEVVVKSLGGGSPVEAEKSLWERRRYKLALKEEPLEKALGEIKLAAEEGRKVLVIANTVPKAQAIYRNLDKDGANSNIHLLHSRFTFRDRQAKEALIERPKPGAIVVSTQVVEVSLDISYDVLFSQIAPLDALVQRMGRVNRRGNSSPAPVEVFLEWDKGSEWVYDREILEHSVFLLRNLPSIPSDGELKEATNLLYDRIAAKEEYIDELKEGRETLDYVQNVLGCYTIDLSDDEMRSRFVTRRQGVVSMEVLPEVYLDEAYRMVEEGEKWRLVELMVSIPAYWIFGYLKEWFYPSEELGVYISKLPYSYDLGVEFFKGDETFARSVFI